MTIPRFPLQSMHSLVLAGLLATVGMGAVAQQATPTSAPAVAASAAPADAKPAGHHTGRRDPARMQAWIAKRQAELKTKLAITPAQEGAWTAYTAAMQPPAIRHQRMTPEQRAEIGKLPTPERIDRMRALRTQHMAEMTAAMDKRADATKAFYAALTPAQQQTFDAEYRNTMQAGRGGHHRGHGGHHGGSYSRG